MRKIKIMHILLTFGIAGLQKQVANIINALNGVDGLEFSVCCIEEKGCSEYELPSNCSIFVMRKRLRPAYSLPLKLSKLFRKEKIDVVHSHGFATQLYTVAGSLFARAPILINGEHGGILQVAERKRLVYLTSGILSRFTERIHTTSRDLKEKLVNLANIRPEKITPIPNGVELDKFKKIPRAKEKYDFINPGDVVIGSVGRLAEVKNYHLLLRVIPIVKKRVPNAKIIIAGDGPQRRELQELAKKLSVENDVCFLGWRNDMPELLNTMDIMVLTSLSEGLSNTILEAMACEVPVVASDVGGNNELVEDGKTGLLFPSQDSEALAEKLILLAENEQQRRFMGANARKKAEREFSLDRMIGAYKKLYLDLAERCL